MSSLSQLHGPPEPSGTTVSGTLLEMPRFGLEREAWGGADWGHGKVTGEEHLRTVEGARGG